MKKFIKILNIIEKISTHEASNDYKAYVLHKSKQRFFISVFIIMVILVLLLSRLFYISLLVPFDLIKKISSGQNYQTFRYDILDRNGNALSLNIPSTSVYLRPREIRNKQEVINHLVYSINDMSEDEAMELVSSNKPFVWVRRNVSSGEYKKLLENGLPGLRLEKGYTRFHPYGSLFAHIIGMTNVDGVGVSGMEKVLNGHLRINSVKTSLDLKLQNILYKNLSNAMNNHKPKSAFGIIVDPNSGEILALVSLPSFDPNDRDTITPENSFNNVTQGLYEFGSVFKIFAMAGAVDSGMFDLSKQYDVSKPLVIGNSYAVVDYSYIESSLNLPEILMRSSNIGSALLARDLGSTEQKRFLKALGLVKKLILPYNEVAQPIFPKKWDDIATMTISYGYGLATTQANLALALSTIVNGGIRRPLTFYKINDVSKVNERRVLSEHTSAIMRGMGRIVVAYGSGIRANTSHVAVGGKTGSGEKQFNGTYNRKKVISSFASFFPAYKPKYVLIVSLDEPTRNKYNGYNVTGGRVAGQITRAIIDDISRIENFERKADSIYLYQKSSPSDLIRFVESIKSIDIE